MAPQMDDQLGVRLQEEHKALVQLSRVMKEHIAAQPTGNNTEWLRGLRVAFDRLYAHIERSFDMKARDGYLETILEEQPSLARQVESIKNENTQILRLGASIRAEVETLAPAESIVVNEACARIQRFMTVVAQHEQRENMIFMFAFNQDIGAF